MDIGISYKQKPVSGNYDAIVIGSGIGGLATAAVLAKRARKRVLVLERHYTAGGFTHSFTRPGYEWDVGVHYIGQVGERGPLRAPFEYITEGRLDWAPLPDVYDRVYLGDRSYDFVAGTKRFLATMKERFPSEARALDRYVDLVKACGRAGTPYFLDKALPGAASRVLGPLLRARYLRHARATTAEVMASLTRDRELVSVLTAQFGDYGLPPRQSSFAMHAAVVGHYLGGAYFPVGGSSAIARAIAPTIESAGGAIYVSAEVAQVIVEGGRAHGVRMADGREVRAPVVISDAGMANTFGQLVPAASVPRAATEALSRVSASVGHMCLYLGFEHTDEELGLSGTNLWIYPDGDHDENIARFLADPEAPLPLVYVSFPSAKDPTFRERHPGRATVDVITLARYDWFERWSGSRWKKRGADYDALKERFTERILEVLFSKVPQLRGKIAFMELSTPLTTRHFGGHPHGELYGLDHTPARFRLPLRPATSIRGLFLTGQDISTCGVGGALLGGVITAAAIEGPGALVEVMRP
ncbi:MAG TPA: NAD(P)/FAD-dependent oxidoreductase [Polyangiaceae bacterium]|nr:NAD(P)/FAD-dependent oxidoreductase [Polyangiaceae bacterium]